MGFKSWFKAQNERYKEAQSNIGGFYGVYALRSGNLVWGLNQKKWPVAGAQAVFETGASAKSPTLGRVAAGAILAGPAGAIVGGLFQKDKTKAYITVTFADESVVIIDGPAKDETKMRDFTQRINNASRHYSN